MNEELVNYNLRCYDIITLPGKNRVMVAITQPGGIRYVDIAGGFGEERAALVYLSNEKMIELGVTIHRSYEPDACPSFFTP